MRPRYAEAVLELAFKHGEPVCLVSVPGCGKTQTIKRVTRRCGFDTWIGHPAISEPVDFKGYPFAHEENGRRVCSFLPDSHLNHLLEATRPTVAFVDDIIQAPAGTQAALMQLVEERCVNGHIVSPQVVFCAATNDAGHMAGGTSIIEPLKARFTVIPFEPNSDDWSDWALGLGDDEGQPAPSTAIAAVDQTMPAALIAFIRTNPKALADFKASKKLTEKSPDPRAWAKVGRWFHMGVRPASAGGADTWRGKIPAQGEPDLEAAANLIAKEVYAGCVGVGAATEFFTFCDLIPQMPSIDTILMDPDGAPLHDRPDVNYLVATALARRVTVTNADRVLRYLWRMEQPFRFACLKDALRIDDAKNGPNSKTPRLRNTAAITTWFVKEAEVWA